MDPQAIVRAIVVDPDEARAAIGSPPWTDVVDCAGREGLLPLLYHHLERRGLADALDAALHDRMREECAADAMRCHECARVLEG